MNDDNVLRSEFVTIDGIRIHFQRVGSGQPLVCLHGGGPGATAWSNFSPNVAALSAHYELILVDMPGFGLSDKLLLEPPALTRAASIINGLAEECGYERFGVLGNSRGGQVGLKMAIDRPELVSRLAVIGSMPGMPSALAPNPPEAVSLIREYYQGTGPSLEKLRHLMRRMVFDPALITDELVQARFEASLDPDVVALGGALPASQDLSGELASIQCPTLIIWGQDDRAGALDVGLMMLRRIPDARLHVFGRCGHWAQLEHRDEFNRLVLDFMEGSRDGN